MSSQSARKIQSCLRGKAINIQNKKEGQDANENDDMEKMKEKTRIRAEINDFCLQAYVEYSQREITDEKEHEIVESLEISKELFTRANQILQQRDYGEVKRYKEMENTQRMLDKLQKDTAFLQGI